MFDSFIQRLILELQKELPGIKAQSEMAPKYRNTDDYKTYPESARKGGVLMLLYPKNQSVFTLVIRRAVNGGSHSGQIAFPGGKFDEQDETLIRTALRETHEEIGIRPEDVTIIGHLSNIYIPPSNFAVLPVIGVLNSEPSIIINNDEVQHIIEIDLNDLADSENKQFREIVVNDVRVITPFYSVSGQHIWGATAMIVSEFLEIIKKTDFFVHD